MALSRVSAISIEELLIAPEDCNRRNALDLARNFRRAFAEQRNQLDMANRAIEAVKVTLTKFLKQYPDAPRLLQQELLPDSNIPADMASLLDGGE